MQGNEGLWELPSSPFLYLPSSHLQLDHPPAGFHGQTTGCTVNSLAATERSLRPKGTCPPGWAGTHAGLPLWEHASGRMLILLQRTAPCRCWRRLLLCSRFITVYFYKAPSCCGGDIYMNKCSIHLLISGDACQLCISAELGVLPSLMFLYSETWFSKAAPTSGAERYVIHQGSVL